MGRPGFAGSGGLGVVLRRAVRVGRRRRARPRPGGYRMALLRGAAVAGISPQFAPGPAALDDVRVGGRCRCHGRRGGRARRRRRRWSRSTSCGSDGWPSCVIRPGPSFAIWQPREHPGAAFVNEPGALCWNELITADVAAAMAFYGPLFGWTRSPMPMGDGEYDVLMLGDRAIGGIVRADGPPWWQVSFAVADCDATVAEAVALGGSVDEPPEDLPDVGPLRRARRSPRCPLRRAGERVGGLSDRRSTRSRERGVLTSSELELVPFERMRRHPPTRAPVGPRSSGSRSSPTCTRDRTRSASPSRPPACTCSTRCCGRDARAARSRRPPCR